MFEQNLQENPDRLKTVSSRFGRKPDIVMWYCDLYSGFPLEPCRRLAGEGILPHIVWEPWRFGKVSGFNLDRILEGCFDREMVRFFTGAREFEQPFYLRWGHEMNGNWYPWSGALNGNRPEKYVRAFRYVRELAEKNGALNPVWIWSPMNDTVPADGPPVNEYYPGDDYADWIGIDGYNWGTGQPWDSSFRPFEELFTPIYDEMRDLYPRKPLMLAEFGSSSAGGDKSSWISRMFQTLEDRFARINAFIYFNINKETDWSLYNSPEDMRSFKQGLDRFYELSGTERKQDLSVNI